MQKSDTSSEASPNMERKLHTVNIPLLVYLYHWIWVTGSWSQKVLVASEKEFKDGHRGDFNRNKFINAKLSKARA
jgi:hypothetical protein